MATHITKKHMYCTVKKCLTRYKYIHLYLGIEIIPLWNQIFEASYEPVDHRNSLHHKNCCIHVKSLCVMNIDDFINNNLPCITHETLVFEFCFQLRFVTQLSYRRLLQASVCNVI